MRKFTQHTVRCNSVDLNLYEWEGSGEPYLLVHATGFHSRCWDEVIKHMPDRHIYAVDMRGHGASENIEPPFSWDDFGEDISELVQKLDLWNVTAVGHSMGGHVVALVAAAHPDRIKQLVLLDPVILNPQFVEQLKGVDTEHPVARRRSQWDSPQQMHEKFSQKNPYQRWHPAVLRDYCEYGLRKNANGDGYTLACPAHIEAAVYLSVGKKIYEVIETLATPVRLIRARARLAGESQFDFDPSPTWEQLPLILKNVVDTQLHDRSHFFPMEIPEQVAGWILE